VTESAQEPTAEEVRQENNPTRKAVMGAMVRMLEGRPNIATPGRLSVNALAQEAGIPRSRLVNGAMQDLGERFLAIAAARQQPTTAGEVALTKALEELREKHQQLRETHARTLAERDQWKAAANAFARIVHLLKVENTHHLTRIETLTRRLRRSGVAMLPSRGSDT
jgi:hypothetical protein